MEKYNQLSEAVKKIVAVFDGIKISPSDATLKFRRNKISDFLNYAEGVLDNTPPSLLPDHNFQNVLAWLNSILIHVTTFGSSKHPNELLNACQRVDQALTYFTLCPTPHPKVTKQAFVKSAISYEKQSQVLIDNLEEKISKISEGLTYVKSETDNFNIGITDENEKLATVQKEIASIVESFQEQLDDFKSENSEKLSLQLEQQKTDFGEANEARDQRFIDHFSAINTRTDEEIEFLENQHEQIKSIVGVIGNSGSAGHFLQQSKKEQVAAWGLFGSALTMFGVLFYVLHYFIIKQPILEADGWMYFQRFGAILALVWLIKILFSKENYHRKLAIYFKEKQANISSLPAFIDTLSKEDKQEILKSVWPEYFISRDLRPTDFNLDEIENPPGLNILGKLVSKKNPIG